MSTENDPNQQHEDYVLVPKRKMKLSRARKFTVIAMVVGAVVSIAGAGTFASFSASTTNDAGFTTARLALENGGPTGCTSPAGVVGNGSPQSAVDSNEATTGCPTLFPTPLKAGVIQSANVDIKNVGDVASNVYLFTEAACSVTYATSTYNQGTATDLCSRVDLSIQGTGVCIFGADTSPADGTCDTLAQGTSNQSFAYFSDKNLGGANANVANARTFANKGSAVASSLAVNATSTFTIKVRMKVSSGGACTGLTDASPVDGFDDTTGRGCDNGYQNQKAQLVFKWLAQAV
jgi:predicted ribosomally synthesized peptide with SipW-like signal peptide